MAAGTRLYPDDARPAGIYLNFLCSAPAADRCFRLLRRHWLGGRAGLRTVSVHPQLSKEGLKAAAPGEQLRHRTAGGGAALIEDAGETGKGPGNFEDPGGKEDGAAGRSGRAQVTLQCRQARWDPWDGRGLRL